MFEKIKKFYKNEYTVKRTYYERPSFLLIGMLYIIVTMFFLVVSSYTPFWNWFFAPLEIFAPYLKPHLEPGSVTIIGWIVVFVVIISLIVGCLVLFLPGLFLVTKHQKLLDKEWPEDPERTRKWRERFRQSDDR